MNWDQALKSAEAGAMAATLQVHDLAEGPPTWGFSVFRPALGDNPQPCRRDCHRIFPPSCYWIRLLDFIVPLTVVEK